MKNILLLALLAGTTAAVAAPTSTTQTGQPSKKEMKEKRKLSKQKAPEVYKGTVAEQSRIITDAPGAEKDADVDDSGKPSKENKKQ